MSYRLIICEKPMIAKSIKEAIGGSFANNDNCFENEDYRIIWAFGHLLTLKDPEDYDDRYKKWSTDDLPIYFNDWGRKVKKGHSARVKQIVGLMKDASCVINAGDIDEEGQNLVDELIDWGKYKGKVYRLDTSDTTISAIKKALNNLSDNDLYVKDGISAYARQVADIIFGYNLTRFYSCKNNNVFSVGRVQTCTLSLVCQRYLDIKNFKKNYFYELFANVFVNGVNIKTKFIPDKENSNLEDGIFLNDSYLKDIQVQISNSNKPCIISKKTQKESPPLPFNINKLNSYCNKHFGYNPTQVMKITQDLREKYSAITYNRSDCQYLSSEHYAEAPEVISSVCQNLNINNNFDTGIKSRCFNDANITAHFAIIPTNNHVDVNKFTKEEENVYKAICDFYLIQFMPKAIKEKTTLKVDINDKEYLSASSVSVVEQGYLCVLSNSKNEDESNENIKELSKLNEGSYDSTINNCNIEKKETKPLKPFNKTTLFNAMGCISKYVTDPEIKELLLLKDKDKKGENGSIGTVATRTAIIERLIEVGYLVEIQYTNKKKILAPTEKGLAFYKVIPDEIKQPNLTAKWWVIQEDIKEGKAVPKDLEDNVLSFIRNIINNSDGIIDYKAESKELCKCPNCDGTLKKGKFGVYCDKKCGFNLKHVFGKPITDEQLIDLCNGKRVFVKGIKKKSGKGTFSAYAVPKEIVKKSYKNKKGEDVIVYQFDFGMEFK